MAHLRTLKVVNFALGAYTAVVGTLFLLLFVLPGLWAWGDGEEAGLLFVLAGLLGFALIAGAGALHVVVGYLVGSGRGRAAQTLLAATQLMSFPFGTAYACYAFWVCWVHPLSCARFDATIKPPIT